MLLCRCLFGLTDLDVSPYCATAWDAQEQHEQRGDHIRRQQLRHERAQRSAAHHGQSYGHAEIGAQKRLVDKLANTPPISMKLPLAAAN
jgi:hypothetical protein